MSQCRTLAVARGNTPDTGNMKLGAALHAHPGRVSRLRERVVRLLALGGVTVDGPNAWDIQVHDPRFFARVLADGSLGLGDSYMDGWWDARDLDGFLYRVLTADLESRVSHWRNALAWLIAVIANQQRGARAFQVGEQHYDLGNDLYECMLDRRMMYSCAYWQNAHTLDDAQESKLELTLGKLGSRPGQHVLDLGCGWGGALKFAAERFGLAGEGVTVSREQAEYARANCRGLPVEIRLQDYRETHGDFDHVFSIGMFEHVGVRNYRKFMRVARRCMRQPGRFLLHTIGHRHSTNHTDPWIDRHIFPNSMIPSRPQIERAIQGIFSIRGWQNIGMHYERTLLAWRANFERSWWRLAARYGERFQRMWLYYLSVSAAAFRARKLEVWQVLLAPCR